MTGQILDCITGRPSEINKEVKMDYIAATDLDRYVEIRDLAGRIGQSFTEREKKILEGIVMDHPFTEIGTQNGVSGSAISQSAQRMMIKLHRLTKDYSKEDIAHAINFYLKMN